MANQPIIIKKVKKGGGHGHHGGAWKLAYADFVTAMMAFFLLMWLLGSTTKETRQGIADYFHDPFKASLSGGASVGDRTSVIPGGGSDVTNLDSGDVQKGKDIQVDQMHPVLQDLNDEALQKQSEAAEKMQLEQLEKEIQQKIQETKELSEFKEQIKLEITPEGLRIVIVDTQNRPMFNLASATAAPHIQMILKSLAPMINSLPNKVSINGHTDALPFPNNQTGYTNWELSSDRANTARRELVKGGVSEAKILRVVGLASSIPYNSANPSDPSNRRISIMVMKKKTEEQVMLSAGTGSDQIQAENKEAHAPQTPVAASPAPSESPPVSGGSIEPIVPEGFPQPIETPAKH